MAYPTKAKAKRVASIKTLRPIAKGEKETCEQEVDVGILENRVKHYDCLPTDDRWVLEVISQDRKRNEQTACPEP